MRLNRLVPILLLLSLSSCATATNAPNLTPLARNAYNLTQLVNSIGILQTAAENAVTAKILPVDGARLIVQFCVIANTAIGQTPNGWQATVLSAYQGTKAQLTPDELIKFGPYLTSFELVLNTF